MPRSYLDDLDACYQSELFCLELVLEFLVSHRLKRTVELLKDEIKDTGFSLPLVDPEVRDRLAKADIHTILNSFSSNDYQKFFKDWSSIPHQLQNNQYKKLTLQLYTYFSIYEKKLEPPKKLFDKITNLNETFIIEKPTSENIPIIDEFDKDSLDGKEEITAMAMFKKFLVDNGSEFSADPEFLPYFALPFVENPKNHPTFSGFYEEQWVLELKTDLERFLVSVNCGDHVTPELLKLVISNKNKKMVSNKICRDIKRKNYELKKDYQKVVGVASELASALEKSVQGEAVDLKLTLTTCIEIFPDLFSNDSTTKIVPRLNIKKIKNDLQNGSIKTKLLLLQSLRWIITKNETGEKENFIKVIKECDLLGISDGSVKKILCPGTTPHPLQQSVSRFLNALASSSQGRDYLENLVELILDIVMESNIDAVTEKMLIATAQKLSFREENREVMVSKNLIEFIINKLERDESASEYILSLLMNLALHIEPVYWEKIPNACYIVVKLMASETTNFKYLSTTICCILRNNALNKSFDLEKIHELRSIKHENLEELEKISKFHRREISIEQELALLLIEDDCVDDINPDIDDSDLVKATTTGEEFLKLFYC